MLDSGTAIPEQDQKIDKATQQYFDRQVPKYGQNRFKFAVRFLNEHAEPDHVLIDVGCGTGKTLAHLKNTTSVKNFVGLDLSSSSLKLTEDATGADTLQGSILEEAFVREHEGTFDYAVLGAVLHHVIEDTRKESCAAATLAISNTLRLLKPGGHLFIMEPTFEPALITWSVFWIKRLIGPLVPGRLHVGPEWINIGQPVVSYYSEARLAEMVASQDAELVEHYVHGRGRKLGVLKLANIGYILKRRD